MSKEKNVSATLTKVKKWLQNELDTYDEVKDDIGDVDSFDDGICEGRHECADNLLTHIKKWEEEHGI